MHITNVCKQERHLIERVITPVKSVMSQSTDTKVCRAADAFNVLARLDGRIL